MIKIGTDTVDLNLIAPFYFKVDKDFKIEMAGISFVKIFPYAIDKPLTELVEIVRPWNIEYSFESFEEYNKQIFIFKFLKEGILFRCQCIPLINSKTILFIGSPWLKNTNELVAHKIAITDYALNDSSTDMIQLMKLNEISIQESSELNTILKQKKKILEKKEQLYRVLVENASDIIFRCNVKGMLTFVNKATKEITGLSDMDLLGLSFLSLIADPYKSSIEKAFTILVESKGTKTSLEYPIKGKNGKNIWLSHNLIAIQEDGIITGYSSVAVDITTRKEMEEAMELAKIKAEESSKLKERFLANTSHEIRTPMNAIIGLSHLLSSTELNGKQKEFLHAIQSSAENLLVVINDILDLSKIESGKIEQEFIAFDLKDKLETMVTSLQIKATDKDIVLSFDWDERIRKWKKGDPFRLNQILTNLISNALKFTSIGFVKLSAELLFENEEEQRILFRVKDSGIGIPKDKLVVIFENFIQADPSISRKYGGTGLGLTISKKLAELMGGSLSVKSEEGNGSEFLLEMTLLNSPEHDKEEETIQIDLSLLKTKKILLVEDNEFNQLLAISILEQWGISWDQAYNGLEAIEKLSDGSYDLILMDIQMPVMGGLEATHILRNDLKVKIPIIALTANAMKEDIDSYLKAGFDSCITKPFEQNVLLDKISFYLLPV